VVASEGGWVCACVCVCVGGCVESPCVVRQSHLGTACVCDVCVCVCVCVCKSTAKHPSRAQADSR
jgi:hypothetical protein